MVRVDMLTSSPIPFPVDLAPRVATVSPAQVLLSSFSTIRRETVRPVEHRGDDFDARFDADTLFFDAFPGVDGRIVLLGPPFLNLLPALKTMTLTAQPSGVPCRFEIRELDRHGQIHVSAPDGTRSLTLAASFGTVDIAISPSELDLFASRRVLFTLSRNNHLSWVKDWIRFARDIHRADAVLFYDNNSTHYTTANLADAIGSLDGIAVARVVNWPFRYGPQGLDAWRFWDSDYCQHGAWEHARRRFLGAARSAQNADVDELVVPLDGRTVFEAAENDHFGIARYCGRWVTGISDRPAAERGERRHTDYHVVTRERMIRKYGVLQVDAERSAQKWTIVPSRCPDGSQWRAHSIAGWLPARRTSTAFSYRHFREINDSWKYDRVGTDSFDPSLHEDDTALKALFQGVAWDR
jgi:hypothetical protein